MLVRRVKPSDLKEILDIVKDLRKWFEPEAVRDIYKTFRNQEGYVAVHRGKVVGFILSRIWKKTAEIKWLAVRTDLHSRGVGTKLLRTMERDLKSRKGEIADITVTTLAPTTRYKHYVKTRQFYANRGYKKLRIDEKYWKKKYDRLVLIKYL